MNTDLPILDLSQLPNRALLRVGEVADFLRLSRDTIYDMVKSGELSAHRRGAGRSALTITRLSVLAFLTASAQYDEHDVALHLANALAKLPAGPRRRVVEFLSRGRES